MIVDDDGSFLAQLRDGLKYKATLALLTGLFAVGAKKKKGRATHAVGVGGRGEARVREQLPLPPHEVWRPGRRFTLILRHANLNNEDDLSADFRGASLKLFDDDGPVLDLLMNTGETTVWSHVEMFAERMMLALRKKLPEFYERHPDALPRYWGGLRRAPDGYDTLAYYSKVTTQYRSADGTLYACRYRLIPEGYAGVDTGLVSERDHREGVVHTDRWPEETRPKDLLRRAYAAKLAEGSIRYTLQIAVREAAPSARDPLYDPSRAWDPSAHPWVDLAGVTVESPMTREELEPLRFNIGNAPESLGIFEADSATDYTSIADLRVSLYRRAANARD